MYLQKALYGLKNSAKAWFDTFSSYLKSLGYKQSHYDDCLWEYKDESKNRKIYIIVFVDDVLAIGDDDYINDFISKISQKFKIRDLGEAETFLGMEIVRDRKRKTLKYIENISNKIYQTKYIENMAERFGFTDAKPVYTPMDPKINLQKAKIKSELHPDNELYRSTVGSAMYAATLSRPDIMFSVCKLSRYLNEPTMAHMTQAKRVLTYLKQLKTQV